MLDRIMNRQTVCFGLFAVVARARDARSDARPASNALNSADVNLILPADHIGEEGRARYDYPMPED
jgi:hypothetical protein